MKGFSSQPTRCLLVQPGFSGHSFWNYVEVCKLVGASYPAAPLGLLTVAALLPQHWEFTLVDENVRPLTDAHLQWADLVLTGGMLPQQMGTLAVIERAHGQGKLVAVGGPDPTTQPRVYERADFLVLGEGEVTIPRFVEDLARGATSGRYEPDRRADMATAVVPRFDLIRFADYMHVGVQFSRGCPYNCEFCNIIELFGRRPRAKAPEQILAELQRLYDLGYRGHVDFVDDNMIGNRARVLEVLEAMRDWSKRHSHPFYFSTEVSINVAEEDRLLELLGENDFRYVFVGFESPDRDVLLHTHKQHNTGISPAAAVRKLAEHGMIVNGGYILGFDKETPETAGRMVDLIQETGVCMAMVGTLFALPDTQLFRRLQQEGRLFGVEQVMVDGSTEVDQTTSGLNFATDRPRTAILHDYARVLQQIYDPRKYYERVLTTAAQLRPARKYRAPLGQVLKLARSFVKASAAVGTNRRTGLLYWKTLLKVLLTNPPALEAAVNLAVMYAHFSKQAEFVVGLLVKQAAYVNGVGEENYNRRMLVGQAAGS